MLEVSYRQSLGCSENLGIVFKDKDPQKAVYFSTGGGGEFGAILNKKA